MNEAKVQTYETVLGHVGQFRLSWKVDFYEVREQCGKGPVVYHATKEKAELAAWREMNRIEQTEIFRWEAESKATEADAVFPTLKPFERPKVVKQKGRGKRIEVVLKGKRG